MTARCAEVNFNEEGVASYVYVCGETFEKYLDFHNHAWRCPAIPRRQSSLELWMQNHAVSLRGGEVE